MTTNPRPLRKLAEFPWEGTHFTREECTRAVRELMDEDRRAAAARRARRAVRVTPAVGASAA